MEDLIKKLLIKILSLKDIEIKLGKSRHFNKNLPGRKNDSGDDNEDNDDYNYNNNKNVTKST